jgi:predicted DNA-binding transcriptional regulator YafY
MMNAARQAIRRLYWIDAILQRGDRPNAPGLAKELGVSRSTIHRDLATLRDEFKTPLLYDPEVGGFLYGHPCRPELPPLSAEEAMELAHALRKTGEIAGTALEHALVALRDRLHQLLTGAIPGAPVATSTETAEPNGELGRARRLTGAGRPARTRDDRTPVTTVVVRFDATAGADLLHAGLLRREEAQLLTDGGVETTLTTRDPDALLLDLLPWAPHFEIGGPAWVRRRLPVLLRRLLRHWDRRPRKKTRSRG